MGARNLFTFGAAPVRWERAHYPYYESIGRLQWDAFDAEAWVPNYPNRAFLNRLPDDTFWAARKLIQLSDDAIRAAVKTGKYSNPAAAAWLTECLIRRRDMAARTYFAKVLPLTNFSIQEGKLIFDDLAVKHRFSEARQYTVRWSRLDGNSGATTPLQEATDSTLPQQVREADAGTYWQARINAAEAGKQVHVTLRCRRPAIEVVGVEYTW
jgi:sulfur transfer complex TusBCD TusB component (DsrH family)